MFILGTICCRGGSKGVPGKNIKLLKGRPLLAYTIETALSAAFLNKVIVSTDDLATAKRAEDLGAFVPFIRPAELATDASSKWPVFIHAIEMFEQQTGNKVDYLVDMDVTVPLKTADDIDGAIEMALENEEAEVVITGYDPERNPYFNMMEINEDGFAEIIKKSVYPIVRRQDAPKVYSLTPAAYVIKKPALYKYQHWSQAKCKIYPIPRERAIDIDTEDDFKLVECMMHDKGKII
jgi:N-acylneuraminate cytidylyltransferase/CMP-N,N'-diacetyllegionaminic acid synthase